MKLGRVFFLGLICGMFFTAKAQTDMKDVFSPDNPNIIYADQPKNYTGSPLVFIEGISDQPQPKDWKDELKIRLFGSMDLPKPEIQKPLPPLDQTPELKQEGILVNSAFGEKKWVQFVPHTHEWNFILQLLNNHEVVVEETIRFIVTEQTKPLVRDWPQQEIIPLKATLNGHEIPFVIQQRENRTSFSLPNLTAGLHQLKLSYLLKDSFSASLNKAFLSIPLTGTGWMLPVNSFSGVVLLPTKAKLNDFKTLLGKNKQEIKDAFEFQEDETGSIFFRATHLIPEKTQIQMDFQFSFQQLQKETFWSFLNNNPSWLIFGILISIILGYLILNIIEFQMISDEEMIHKKKCTYYPSPVLNFLHRVFEITLGILLLFLVTFIVSLYTQNTLSWKQWAFLIILSMGLIFVVDRVILKPRYQHVLKLKRDLLTKGWK